MVQLMKSGNFRSESGTSCRNKLGVKLEIEDSLEEEHGPVNKRSKVSSCFEQQWETGSTGAIAQPTHYNPLDEPSPLGLRLRKSPSLLDLIQMRLTQGNPSILGPGNGDSVENGKKEVKGTHGLGTTTDKLKASNFAASLLRIGTWECISRYEGDLVAKCYFAKHKLVWEVLDGGLKSKMEIQWSDIMALKANCPDNGPGTMDIVLARQPLFFKETNPQPRKHTLWQATSDFTDGQASIHRRHFLQCPQGLLGKHFDKLIQCDPRLNWLSQQPEIVLESPYFEPKSSIFEDPDDSKCHGFKSEFASPYSGLHDGLSPSAGQTSSSKSELRDPVGTSQEHTSRETPSPSSVMDARAIEENVSSGAEEHKGLSDWNQFKVPGIRPSMSMSDLVNHIGNCITEQMSAGAPFPDGSQNKSSMLDDIAQYLLNDANFPQASDETSLMSRVNSFCSLLHKEATTAQTFQVNNVDDDENIKSSTSESHIESKFHIHPTTEGDFSGSPSFKQVPGMSRKDSLGDFFKQVPGMSRKDSIGDLFKQVPGMSRKDSLGDLLLHLPRIASLPQFLFNISEDDDNHAR